jgi:hypothetical protein
MKPSVPFDQQRSAALDARIRLDLSEEEVADLAARIRGAMAEKP